MSMSEVIELTLLAQIASGSLNPVIEQLLTIVDSGNGVTFDCTALFQDVGQSYVLEDSLDGVTGWTVVFTGTAPVETSPHAYGNLPYNRLRITFGPFAGTISNVLKKP